MTSGATTGLSGVTLHGVLKAVQAASGMHPEPSVHPSQTSASSVAHALLPAKPSHGLSAQGPDGAVEQWPKRQTHPEHPMSPVQSAWTVHSGWDVVLPPTSSTS